MLPKEWTRMAIASAIAVIAISFLAVDAGVLNASAVTERLGLARASIAHAGASQHELALAVQAWARGSHDRDRPEQSLATD